MFSSVKLFSSIRAKIHASCKNDQTRFTINNIVNISNGGRLQKHWLQMIIEDVIEKQRISLLIGNNELSPLHFLANASFYFGWFDSRVTGLQRLPSGWKFTYADFITDTVSRGIISLAPNAEIPSIEEIEERLLFYQRMNSQKTVDSLNRSGMLVDLDIALARQVKKGNIKNFQFRFVGRCDFEVELDIYSESPNLKSFRAPVQQLMEFLTFEKGAVLGELRITESGYSFWTTIIASYGSHYNFRFFTSNVRACDQ